MQRIPETLHHVWRIHQIDYKVVIFCERRTKVARSYGTRKRILVTGGAGFLGSHLIDRLLSDGHEVLCVDNLFTGAKRNIEHLLTNPLFEFMRHDVTFPLYVEVDEIYNLACPASPIHYQHDPVQTTKTSVHGAINMLGLAKRLKCRILQASTSEVYGDPAVHPQTEDYWGHVNPIGPRSCYDEGKRCAETLFFDYHRQCGVEIKVDREKLRYSHAIGRVAINGERRPAQGLRSGRASRVETSVLLGCGSLKDGLVFSNHLQTEKHK